MQGDFPIFMQHKTLHFPQRYSGGTPLTEASEVQCKAFPVCYVLYEGYDLMVSTVLLESTQSQPFQP